MSIQVVVNKLSLADSVVAKLLPADFALPAEVTSLSKGRQERLLQDLLTPVARKRVVYQAQRALLVAIADATSDNHLRQYCQGLCRLSPRAWDYVVKHGKPTNVARAVVTAGALNDMEAPAITNLSVHFHELRRYAHRSQQAA